MKTRVNKFTLSLIAASILAAPLAFAGDNAVNYDDTYFNAEVGTKLGSDDGVAAFSTLPSMIYP